jgi:hypothetical protein
VGAAALAVVWGCSSHEAARSRPAGSRPADGIGTAAGSSSPYRLYTHCGIEWASIDGVYWHADQHLSDGGNPPPGWGDPLQVGTLTISHHATAEFVSAAGSVTFRRTDRTEPPVLCS